MGGTDGERHGTSRSSGRPAADPEALLGQTLGGRFRLVEIIGTGGMGTVFRGQHVIIERPVAVKVLASSATSQPGVRERFFREARAASRIQHKNVLDVLDVGESESGQLYIVMELLEGQTLFQRLQSGPLPLDVLLDVFLEVCDGLAAAHSVGVVHRDVSPSNVFLVDPGSVPGPSVRAKLVDFGIAFMKSEARLTVPGQVLGTPYYIAPEATRNAAVTPASDIYSFGATMYEALCGRPPFDGPTYAEILLKHVTEDPPPITARCPGVPPRLANLVHACLEKAPERRPTGMDEVAQVLQAVARDVGRRSSRNVAARSAAAPAPLQPEGDASSIGSGLRAWKEYLRSVSVPTRAAPASPARTQRIAEMEVALAELERTDEELAARREQLAETEARLAAAGQRFGRALEALREEQARLDAAGGPLRQAFDAARRSLDAAQAALAEARSRVTTAEGVAVAGGPRSGDAATPGDAPAGDDLLQALEAAGTAATRLRETRAAERAARRAFDEWQAEVSDVRFQSEQLVANASRAREGVAADSERGRREIAELERSRSAVWQKLIGLASELSGKQR